MCLLGSINLTQFVDVEHESFNYDELAKWIPSIVRFMDNVNDITYVPLDSQKENLKNKRRIGIGVLGYGSALMMLRIRYGSEKALKLTDELMRFITNHIYKASSELAAEKGVFPAFDKEKYLQSNFIKMSLDDDTVEMIKRNGMRNSHCTSLQPTGNTSIFANQISSGIEPVFRYEYIRTSIVPTAPDGLDLPKKIDWDNKTFVSSSAWKWMKEGDESMLTITYDDVKYKFDRTRGLVKENLIEDYSVHYLKEKKLWDENAQWVATVENLTIKEHVDTMAVLSKYIDSAMSKCIVEGTMITTDKGIVPIESLSDNDIDDSFSELNDDYHILDMNGDLKKITKHYNGGEKDCYDITFDNGFNIECAYTHKFNTENGWVSVPDLKEGDKVFFRSNEVSNKTPYIKMDYPSDLCKSGISLPQEMNEDYAKFIGLLLSNGILGNNGITLTETENIDKSEIDRLYNVLFNKDIYINLNKKGKVTHILYSKQLALYFKEMLGKNSYVQKIPDIILRSNDDVKRSFLVGLAQVRHIEDINDSVIYDGGLKDVQIKASYILSSLGYGYQMSSAARRCGAMNKIFYTLKVQQHNTDLSSVGVSSVKPIGTKKVYDIEVEDTHSYLINGIVSHNTVNLPNEYPYEDFKNLYMNVYDSKTIKGITSYRAGTMTAILSSTKKDDKKEKEADKVASDILQIDTDKLGDNQAPKRPKTLPCDINRLTVKGVIWIVLVGKLGDRPYEVFAFKKKDISLSDKVNSGFLTKVRSGRYDLEVNGVTIEDIKDKFESDEQEALTRLISLALRHSVSINYIFEQLQKSEGTIISFSKAIARTLKKYLDVDKIQGETCPNCGQTMSMVEGCMKCMQCGYSKCG